MSREATEQSGNEIKTTEDLMKVFVRGARPREQFKLGLETEKIGVYEENGEAVPYFGDRGIKKILEIFAEHKDWQPVFDHDNLVALSRKGAAITLEPGGQFELSGMAHTRLQDMKHELYTHVDELIAISDPLGIKWMGLGIQPVTTVKEARWVPKSRYKVMRGYYEKRGGSALEMMTLTAATQLNLDYLNEADAKKKVFLGTALAPIISGILANSYVDGGKANGYCSRRLMIWLGTDVDRCGAPAFFMDGSFSFERYRDYALDTPMYFIYRHGEYIDYTHSTFRNYIKNPGQYEPTETDWINHLTTLFPDVRLKDHLEYRTADSTPKQFAIGLAAFWAGLVYNQDNLDELMERFKQITPAQQALAIREAALKGMAGEAYGKKIREWAKELVPMVYRGLANEDHGLFEPMEKLICSGKSLAEKVQSCCGKLGWHTFQDNVWFEV